MAAVENLDRDRPVPGCGINKQEGFQVNVWLFRANKYSSIGLPQGIVITTPEVTNTSPGLNRGSGGGARGCGIEERVGAYERTEVGHFL